MTHQMARGAQVAFGKSWLERQNIESQTVDVHSHIDGSLSYEENIKKMKRMLGMGGRSTQQATRTMSAGECDVAIGNYEAGYNGTTMKEACECGHPDACDDLERKKAKAAAKGTGATPIPRPAQKDYKPATTWEEFVKINDPQITKVTAAIKRNVADITDAKNRERAFKKDIRAYKIRLTDIWSKTKAKAKPKAAATPKFKTVEAVRQWIDKKIIEYGSKNKFFASNEYADAYPLIKKIRAQARKQQKDDQKKERKRVHIIKDLPKRKTALKTPKPAAKPAKRKAKTTRKKTPSTGKKHVYAKPKKLMSMVGGVKQSTIEGGTTKTPRKKTTTGKRGIPDKIPNRIKDLGWVNIKTQQVQVECKKLAGVKAIRMPEDVADMVGDMSKNDREEVRVVYMDQRNKVIGVESAHKGSVNACHCEPHEIFKTALLLNANQVILVHNHPSGEPTPSDADIMNAERFRHNGKMLGVTVRDSIIIGRNKFYSLQQEGHFK